MSFKTKISAFLMAAVIAVNPITVLGANVLERADKTGAIPYSEMGFAYELNAKGIYSLHINKPNANKLIYNFTNQAATVDLDGVKGAKGIEITTSASYFTACPLKIILPSQAVLTIGENVMKYIAKYYGNGELVIYFDQNGKINLTYEGQIIEGLPADTTMTLKMPFSEKEGFKQDNIVMEMNDTVQISRSYYENGFVTAEISNVGTFRPVYIQGGIFVDTGDHWADEFIKYAHARGLMDAEVYLYFWPEEYISPEEFIGILETVFNIELEVEGIESLLAITKYPMYLMTFKVLEFVDLTPGINWDTNLEDFEEIGEEWQYIIAALVAEGIIEAPESAVDAMAMATRAEAAQLISEIIKYANNK